MTGSLRLWYTAHVPTFDVIYVLDTDYVVIKRVEGEYDAIVERVTCSLRHEYVIVENYFIKVAAVNHVRVRSHHE